MTSMRILGAVAFTLLSQTAMAENSLEPTERSKTACAVLACRPGGYETVIRLDAEHYTNIPVSLSPYVTEDGSILILPGETIAIQFAIDGDKIGPAKFLQAFAPEFPAQMQGEDKVIDNPADASLPKIPESLPPNTSSGEPFLIS